MHTFLCIVGLPYRFILVCEHDIICVNVCLYKYTNEIDVLWLWFWLWYLVVVLVNGSGSGYGYGYG